MWQEGTPLVDGKLKIFWWEKNSATGAPYDHSGRCLDKRVRHTARESFDRGAWSKKEKHFHIKMFKELSAELIIDIKIFNPNFQEEFVRPDHSCSSGQQSCCVCLQAVSPTSPIWHGSQIQTVLQQMQCSRTGNAVHDRHNLGIPSY